MTSKILIKYSTDELVNDTEFIRWAGEIETLEILNRNLKELSEAEICS